MKINPPEAALDKRWTWWIAQEECGCPNDQHLTYCRLTPIYASMVWLTDPPVGRY